MQNIITRTSSIAQYYLRTSRTYNMPRNTLHLTILHLYPRTLSQYLIVDEYVEGRKWEWKSGMNGENIHERKVIIVYHDLRYMINYFSHEA